MIRIYFGSVKTKSIAKASSWFCLLLFVCFVTSSFVTLVVAQEIKRDAKITAGFIYYTCLFVSLLDELPPSVPLNVCSLGIDPTSIRLGELLKDKRLKEHPVHYEMLSDGQNWNPDTLTSCNIAYITNNVASKKPIEELGLKKKTLTISPHPEILKQGGMIQIFLENDKVKYNVDLDKATEAQIKISSELLGYANTVLMNGKIVRN